jgi:type II secretory pathway pseudopilin PulG
MKMKRVAQSSRRLLLFMAGTVAVLVVGGLWWLRARGADEIVVRVDYSAKLHQLAIAQAATRKPADAPDAEEAGKMLEQMLASHATWSEHCREDLRRQHPELGEVLQRSRRFDFELLAKPHLAESRGATAGDIRLAQLAFTHAANAGERERLLEVGSLSHAVLSRPGGVPMIDEPRHAIGKARQATRLLSAVLHEQIVRGDVAGAASALRALLALGASIANQGDMIARNTGVAIEGSALDIVREAASNGRLTPGLARALLAELQRAQPHPIELVFEGERMFVLDVIQRTYTDDGSGDGKLVPRAAIESLSLDSPPALLQAGAGGIARSRKETTKLANALVDAAIRAARQPHHARSLAELDALVASLDNRDIVLQIVLSDMKKPIASQDRHATQLAGAKLLLAIQLYRAENNRLPASLRDLVPGVLLALPIDGFAPDGMFRMLRREPTSDDARDFFLYSVGADAQDNQGRPVPSPRSELLSLRAEGVGTDWVINAPPSPAAKPAPREERAGDGL